MVDLITIVTTFTFWREDLFMFEALQELENVMLEVIALEDDHSIKLL